MEGAARQAAQAEGGRPPAVDHTTLTWDGSPGACLSCHGEEAEQDAILGPLPVAGRSAGGRGNRPLLQGKLTNAINSYCVSILGNWNLRQLPRRTRRRPVRTATPTTEQLLNVDCLVCHNGLHAARSTAGRPLSANTTTPHTPTASRRTSPRAGHLPDVPRQRRRRRRGQARRLGLGQRHHDRHAPTTCTCRPPAPT